MWGPELRLAAGELPPPAWAAALAIVVERPHSVDKRLAGQVEVAAWRGEALAGALITRELVEEVRGKLRAGGEVAMEGVEGGRVAYRLQRVVARKAGRMEGFHQVVAVAEGAEMEAWPVDPPPGLDSAPWGVRLQGSEVVGRVGEGGGALQRAWVEGRLLPRLAGWAAAGEVKSPGQASLRLVGVEEYTAEYARLKASYAKDIIDNWEESSDPEKFVHEDLGIAAYLLLLWRRQRAARGGRLQTFVDLGCGNGLLVHLLAMEGHSGVGYDLRRRGVWAQFEAKGADLREEVVSPGLDTIFPAADWILGNHSDELTPWLPVMAALSGPSTSYWVLPCCPHAFAAKYQRRDASKSVFRDYLDWVAELGREAGFQVEEDKMRIPSTKRVCQVGEVVGEEEWGARKARVAALVAGRAEGFVAREKVERVRNCSKVERGLVADIVARVAAMCLAEAHVEEVEGRRWNKGRSLALGEVVEELVRAGVELTKLKAECGGLQTLLRNHHQVFLVSGGRVAVRVPGTAATSRRKGRPLGVAAVRTKPCWHHHHHPDGCPLAREQCTWLHGGQDTG